MRPNRCLAVPLAAVLASASVAPAGAAIGTHAERSYQILSSPDAQDASAGRMIYVAPLVKVAPPGDGVDWGDVGIGAVAGLGLSALTVGGSRVLVGRQRHRRYGTAGGLRA